MNYKIRAILVEVLNGGAGTSWALWRAEFAAKSNASVTAAKCSRARIVARLTTAQFVTGMIACHVRALPCTRFLCNKIVPFKKWQRRETRINKVT